MVPYQPALKTQVIELQTHLWGPSLSLNTTYFEWKYERNPYIDEPLIFLAMHHDRAVGMRGFFGVQWEGGIPTEKCIGLYADDLVIVPEHRNQGLIPRIMAAAFEDLAKRRYQFVFNLSAGPVTFLSSLAMDWRSVGSMRPWRWRSWKAACKNGMYRLLKRWPGGSPKPAELFLKWAASRRRPLAEVKNKGSRWPAGPEIAVEDSPRCAAMAELVERIGSRGYLRHVRDQNYFDWRFQNPFSRYRFLFWGKDRLEGYLVLQEYTAADQEVINVVDWEATNIAVKDGLLKAAFYLTSNRYLIIWTASLTQETTDLLHRHGFTPLKGLQGLAHHQPALLVRPIRSEALAGDWLLAGRPLTDMASWDLRMLYSMHG